MPKDKKFKSAKYDQLTCSHGCGYLLLLLCKRARCLKNIEINKTKQNSERINKFISNVFLQGL